MSYRFDRSNLTVELFERARTTPSAPALILEDRELTYGQLDGWTWRCARFLRENGVRQGSIVGLCCESERVFVVTMLALARMGATVVTMPTNTRIEELQDLCRNVSMVCLATDRRDLVDAGTHPVVGIRSVAVSGPIVGRMSAEPEDSLMPAAPQAPWQIIIGSGTTGRPKLFPVTHAQQRVRIDAIVSWLGLEARDRCLHLSSLDFVGPKSRLLSALFAGASFALLDRRPRRVVELCREHGFTILDATVFHVEGMLRALEPGTVDALPSVRAMMMSSSTIGDELRRRIRHSLTPHLHVVYGTNEAGVVSVASPPQVFDLPGSVGRLLPGVDIRIVDHAGSPLPEGQVGTLWVRGASVIDGYLGDPEESARAFRDGWFCTGDLVRMESSGDLVYYGRGDHMMILNGINIYPAEIEQVVDLHPDVIDVAVMPIRHRIHQDVPICAVRLAPDATVSEAELLAYARSRLGSRGPHKVYVVDRIPRNEQGKLVRAELAKLLLARLKTAQTAD